MLSTTSNGIENSEHESQATSSHSGKLSRLLLKFRRPLVNTTFGLQKPRRSIDRELQEREPMDLL
jgi:hypothetical protein